MTTWKRRLLRRANRELQQLSYNRQRVAAVGKPVVFQIELTNHCPMTCQMCPRTHAMQRPLGYMERSVYERVVDEAAASTSRVFLHHFGESLLHPDLGPLAAYASARGIDAYLSANPTLLNASRIRALVDGGVYELVLSLDGVTPETSEAVRGRAARDVDLAERRIHELLAYRERAGSDRPHVVLQIVRQKQNAHEVDAWVEKWKDTPGLDRVKVKSYVTWDGRLHQINRLRPEQRSPGRAVVCDKPWTSVTVLWDGRVVPCCFDYDGTMTLGDVHSATLQEIWEGDRLAQLRENHRDGALADVTLCGRCEDKEGYPVKKWYYPLNRLLQHRAPLDDEWSPR